MTKSTTTAITAMTAGPTEHTEPSVQLPDVVVMSMLHEHVPLSLLCDLTAPEGPQSAEILAEEGEPESRWWEQ